MNDIAAIGLVGKYVDVELRNNESLAGYVKYVDFTPTGTEVLLDYGYGFKLDDIVNMRVTLQS